MKLYMRYFIILMILVFGMSGCAISRTDFARLNPNVFPPIPEGQYIPLTTMGLDNIEYEEIGFLHVSGKTREEYCVLNTKLRAEARRVGADAVIYVTYGVENAFTIVPIFVAISYDVLTAEGLAVKMKK